MNIDAAPLQRLGLTQAKALKFALEIGLRPDITPPLRHPTKEPDRPRPDLEAERIRSRLRWRKKHGWDESRLNSPKTTRKA